MKKFISILFLFQFSLVFSQVEILREHCHCAIGSDSYFNIHRNDTATLQIHPPNVPNVKIKKAFLLNYFQHHIGDKQFWGLIHPIDTFMFHFDEQPMRFYEHELIQDTFLLGAFSVEFLKIRSFVYLKDITQSFDTSRTTHSFRAQNEVNFSLSGNDGAPFFYMLLVIYESPDLAETLISIVSSEKYTEPEIQLDLSPYIQDLDTHYNIANAAHLIGNFAPLTDLSINDSLAGRIGGFEYNGTLSYGTHGTYSFYNNELYSYANDTANNTVNGTDVTLYLNSYIDSTLLLVYTYDNEFPGVVRMLTPGTHSLLYTSTCDSADFPAIELDDYSYCRGQSFDLVLDSTYFYEWEPVKPYDTLNFCHDCYYQHIDSSTPHNFLLTIRRFENSLCYKRHPVFVVENKGPSLNVLELIPDTCNQKRGEAVLEINHSQGFFPLTLSDQGGSETIYSADTLLRIFLKQGINTLTIEDAMGCILDTFFILPNSNNVIASFLLSDSIGYTPFEFMVSNTSQNATQYTWIIDSDTLTTNLSNYSLNAPTGSYFIQLIARGIDSTCADTTFKTLHIIDSHWTIEIPNVITPNSDKINDVFGIYSSRKGTAKVEIVNRWGNVLAEQEIVLRENTYNPIDWSTDSQTILDGVYFYTILLTMEDGTEQKRNGFFHIEK